MLGKESRYIEGMALGMWHTNCYILGDLELGTCVVVDPGQTGTEAVRERLAERQVRCEAILCTHGHIDHIWSVPELAAELDVPVFLHPEDRWLWEDPTGGMGQGTKELMREHYGLQWEPSADLVIEDLREAMTVSFCGYDLLVRHTPGHTPGSSVFLLTDTGEDDPLLLSGDLLFRGSVGRTDFPRSSHDQQMEALGRVVLPMDDETLVLPGHGPETTVGVERATNPFLRSVM